MGHPFLSIVMIAILTTIGRAKRWEDIETYSESPKLWIESFLELPADTCQQLVQAPSTPSKAGL